MMQGASGTVTVPSAGSLTGTAPTNWTTSMSNTTGLTVAASQLSSPRTGLPVHQFAFSGSYTVAGSATGPTYCYYARLTNTPQNAAVAAIQAGDTYEALIAFEIDAGNACISFPRLEWRWGDRRRSTRISIAHRVICPERRSAG